MLFVHPGYKPNNVSLTCPRMFTECSPVDLKNSLKFLLLRASITFPHQECHNYGMSKGGVHEINLTIVDEVDKGGGEMKGPDIWQDTTCLALLREGVLLELIELEESKRVRKRATNYCWKE